MRLLLLLFIAIPILEIALLIQVGSLIGLLPTVFLVVFTATVGVWLLRLQGLNTLYRLQNRMASGEMPARELLEGAMLLVGGALLLTPGFVTDAIGFCCLLPMLRQPIARQLIRFAINNVNIHVFSPSGNGPGNGQPNGPRYQGPGKNNNRGGVTIDGTYEDDSDKNRLS